jgi:hypothetical protein
VEKPCFLFLEGSAEAAVAPVAAVAALLDDTTVRAGTSAARATSSTDCPAEGAPAPAPGACFSAATAALSEGARDSTSRGESAPHHSLLPPPTTTSTPGLRGERVPTACAAGIPRPVVPGASATGSSAPSCAPPTLAPAVAPRARPLGLGTWAGRTAWRPWPPSARKSEVSESHRRVARE